MDNAEQGKLFEETGPVVYRQDKQWRDRGWRQIRRAQQLEQAAAETESAEKYYKMARLYEGLGNGEEAIRHYQFYLGQRDGDDPVTAAVKERLTALGGEIKATKEEPKPPRPKPEPVIEDGHISMTLPPVRGPRPKPPGESRSGEKQGDRRRSGGKGQQRRGKRRGQGGKQDDQNKPEGSQSKSGGQRKGGGKRRGQRRRSNKGQQGKNKGQGQSKGNQGRGKGGGKGRGDSGTR